MDSADDGAVSEKNSAPNRTEHSRADAYGEHALTIERPARFGLHTKMGVFRATIFRTRRLLRVNRVLRCATEEERINS